MTAGIRRVDDLDLPNGLTNYYRRYATHAQYEPDWDALQLPVLATLAAAGEPLTTATLARLAGVEDETNVRRLCDHTLRPFLSVVSDLSRRYEVYHASFREFLHGQVPVGADCSDEAERVSTDLRLATLAAHNRIADSYLAQFGGLTAGLPSLVSNRLLADLDDGYARRHLVTHLDQTNRTDDLHRLLDCQRQSGSGQRTNLWFDIHDRAGTVDSYLDDLYRAQRVAATATDRDITSGRQATSLGLEIRYAIMIASVHNVTNRVPSDLLAALTESGVWSLEQALAHANRMAHPTSRFKALMALRPHTPAEHQSELLAAAVTAAVAAASASDLTEVAAFLPQEMLASTFEAARSLADEAVRGQAIVGLARYLSDDLITEAISAVCGLQSGHARYRALIGLSPYIGDTRGRKQMLTQALTAGTQKVDGYLSKAIGTLAPHLPRHLLSRALSIVSSIQDAHTKSYALTDLVKHLPVPLLPAALAAARTIEGAEAAARVWTALGQRLLRTERSAALTEAHRAASAIADDGARSEALATLAPHLSSSECTACLDEALDAVPFIKDRFGSSHERARTDALLRVVPQLPPELLGRALRIASDIDNDFDRGRVVIALTPRLPPDLLVMALEAARPRHDYSGPDALIGMSQYLPAKLRDKAVAIAAALPNPHSRSTALRELAQHLPDGQCHAVLNQAITAARSIDHVSARAEALTALVPHVAADMRPTILAEAAATTATIDHSGTRCAALLRLAAKTPPEQHASVLLQALAAATAIKDGDALVRQLSKIIPHLPADQAERVLEAARTAALALEDESRRADALIDLIAHTHSDRRAAIIEQAFDAVTAIPDLVWKDRQILVFDGSDGSERARSLTRLAMDLPNDLLARAFTMAKEIPDKKARMDALLSLASRLDENNLAHLLSVVVDACDDYNLADNLATLARSLPDTLLEQALRNVATAGSEYTHAKLLAKLAPFLPDILLDHALGQAMAIADVPSRVRALTALTPRLRPGHRTTILRKALELAASVNENDVRCAMLARLIPVLPAVQQASVLNQFLDAADGDRKPYDLEQIMVDLAAHMPPRLRVEIHRRILSLARRSDGSLLVHRVLELAPSLGPELCVEAFSAALDAISKLAQSEVANHAGMYLADLGPHLAADLVLRAFAVADAMPEYHRAQALGGLTPHLPSELRLHATEKVLDTQWAQFVTFSEGDSEWASETYVALVRRGMSRQPRTRADVIRVMASLAPAITMSGGNAAWWNIGAALNDSFAWWP